MSGYKGFTLIEVLIALIIVAVGVLGHAKMQAKSMDMAQRASFTQTANIALTDLAQRLRANADLAPSFIRDNLSGNVIVAAKNCSLVTCSDSEFATAELAEWLNHLRGSLPSPSFSVVNNSSVYTLTLIWDAAKTGASSAVCDAGNPNSYQCGSLSIWIP